MNLGTETKLLKPQAAVWAVSSSSTVPPETLPAFVVDEVRSFSGSPEAYIVFARRGLFEIAAKMEPLGYVVTYNPWSGIENPNAVSSTALTESERRQLSEVRRLVEAGRVSEARHRLHTLRVSPERYPEIEAWRKVLAEPIATLGDTATGSDNRQNSNWLREYASQHRGQWLALRDSVLLGSHQSRAELHRMLKRAGQLTGAMFFKAE